MDLFNGTIHNYGRKKMLQLKNIVKTYITGELQQHALKDVSISFRENEFVSILGQSGSGKTTMLNIIGGLDRYTSGDLLINGVSTKEYKDSDWDYYRNNSIGFVFQSYNLIPHQSVLANVELALTLAGVSKKERRQRAVAVLKKVGLEEHIHKKPNQMSGGQMQRVAIARALINNPDILLADEPTGALDSETSVQIMELLKEIAEDKLVIMVTHNPELAQEYSTRIVRLLDGEIISDTDPYNPVAEDTKPHKKHKISMSFLTALSLSFNNLKTKKGRTFLTAFAGSIGIIGIALILALSAGFQEYIDDIQEDALTSYPLSIYAETGDTTSMILSMVSQDTDDIEGSNIVREKKYISTMYDSIRSNDMTSLKQYLEDNEAEVSQMVNLIDYSYAITPLIYSELENGDIVQLNPGFLSQISSGAASSMMSVSTSVFTEAVNMDSVKNNYKLLAGTWPENYDEVIIMLPSSNEISDLLVYSLGLKHPSDLKSMMTKIMQGEEVVDDSENLEVTYDDLLNLQLRLVDASSTYEYNKKYEVYESMTGDEDFMKKVYEKSVPLKVVGIASPDGGVGMVQGVLYTKELTEYVINTAEKSHLVQAQLKNKDIDVFSGNSFDEENEKNALNFEDMISVDTDMLSDAFGMDVSEEDIANLTGGYINQISASITADTTPAKTAFETTLVTITTNMLNAYYEENKDENTGMAVFTEENIEAIVSGYMASEEAGELLTKLETDFVIPKDVFVNTYSQIITGILQGYIRTSPMAPMAALNPDIITAITSSLTGQVLLQEVSATMAKTMTEAVMQRDILTKVGELSQGLVMTIAGAFNVDADAIAGAFNFELSEDELSRLMEAMSGTSVMASAETNLLSLGYQNIDEPTAMSFYFEDFEKKEAFTDYLENYNEKVVSLGQEDKEISYTDITAILISSVKTIVDNVSYVLIAFVSISLIVSSIMIGIITYISVLERTKEIGILRSIGASKKDISRVFNAETAIVGTTSGLIGIGTSLLLIIPINAVIEHLSGVEDLAFLPGNSGIILVAISIVLTIISGLIPAKYASKKDPVEALRTE
ncbi:MAG: ABC transporter ATP-binding protein/permease [Anaerofustis stercorihominis]|nr:ABC transporter ATP-binding protein/permease [Anaerofustis stercorihominis]